MSRDFAVTVKQQRLQADSSWLRPNFRRQCQVLRLLSRTQPSQLSFTSMCVFNSHFAVELLRIEVASLSVRTFSNSAQNINYNSDQVRSLPLRREKANCFWLRLNTNSLIDEIQGVRPPFPVFLQSFSSASHLWSYLLQAGLQSKMHF